ncbi:MAG: flagella basal body P-ring formation protein FlgA [Pseudomonadota bacterium]
MWRAALLALLAQPALAAGYPDGLPGAEVARLVSRALEAAGLTATVAAPLRAFPACGSVPDVTARNGDWRTAEITCPAPRWSRALRTGAQAATAAPDALAAPAAPQMAVTLARSLPRGAVVAAGDLTLAPVAGLGPDDIFTDPAEVAGRRLKSAVGAGRPLLLRHVEPRWLVQPGAPLLLEARAGGLSVTAPAEAREAGLLGDVVRVVNLSSGREVKATVTGPNRVSAGANIP